MKSFSLAGVIVLPEARYVATTRQLFHTKYVEAEDRDGNIKYVCECGHIDCSGYCMGHHLSKKEFINQFCNGKIPQEFVL